MGQFCTKCGAKMSDSERFCLACGAQAEETNEVPGETKRKRPSVSRVKKAVAGAETTAVFVSKITGSTAFASVSKGEVAFTQALTTGKMADSAAGPAKYLLEGLKKVFQGIRQAGKDKKKRRTVIILSVLWLLLSILSILGLRGLPIRILSFITFAQGGMSGGLFGMIGGILGKGMIAFFFTSMILPAFSGKNPFSGINRQVKSLIRIVASKDRKNITALLWGGGAALIAYNVMAGNASLQNSMAGIAAFVLSLRALTNKAGFLRGLVFSVANRFGKGKIPDTGMINRLMAGFTSGFALSVILSASGIGIICYIAGAAALIAAMVLRALTSKNKEVAVK